MEEFVQIYENNRKEAVDIFFLPNFEEVFLQGKPEQKELYHSLMKSRSKSLILEEFLTAAGYKNTSFLDVSQDKLVLEEEDSQDMLREVSTVKRVRFRFQGNVFPVMILQMGSCFLMLRRSRTF